MQAERPHIFVVDDDRAVLSLVGTNVSCLEVLRALRSVSPQCEAVLTTGYQSVEAAVDALRESLGGSVVRCAVIGTPETHRPSAARRSRTGPHRSHARARPWQQGERRAAAGHEQTGALPPAGAARLAPAYPKPTCSRAENPGDPTVTAAAPTTVRRQPRVLVADDTATIRALFEKLLTGDGYQVISAVDGIEALDAVSVYQPDVVVTDVGMPGVDGIEVCRRLKRDPSTHLTPVVLVTGLSDLPDRIRGIEAGADDFLTKPVHPQELRARVAALLRMKQLTDALDSAESAFIALAMTIEARDPTTRGHCERLAHHAVLSRSRPRPLDRRPECAPSRRIPARRRQGGRARRRAAEGGAAVRDRVRADEAPHGDWRDAVRAAAVASARAPNHSLAPRAARRQRLSRRAARRPGAAACSDCGDCRRLRRAYLGATRIGPR